MVHSGPQPVTVSGIDDAIDSVRVIESAYTSVQQRRWLKVGR
jgi:hypothetical protein